MSNQSDAPNQEPRTVQDIIQAIEVKCVDGTYLFRGEPQRHEGDPYYGKVSSTLWRKYREEAEYCDIEAIQNEMLNGAKKHLGHIAQGVQPDLNTVLNVSNGSTSNDANFELLTEIQHYGGATNLIDFTTDYFIALFFACDGFPNEDGRVVIQEIQSIKNMIRHPNNPRHRVIAQKSVFLRPPKGFIEPQEDHIVAIPAKLKYPLLEHLRKYHGISTETIYNDLHGYIIHQGIHEGAYTRFFRGVACFNAKKYGEAIEHCSKAIRVKPDFADAYYNRGVAYSDAGDCDSAIADYTRAIELNPTDAEAYNNRGWAFGNQGDYESALADYTKAIESNPNHAIAYCNRGRTYSNTGDDDSAIADYTAAIQLNPNYVEAYYDRGNAYFRRSQYDCAISDFTTAIELKPDMAKAYNNRGVAYNDEGDFDRAIADYIAAIQLNPDDAEAYYNRGGAHYRMSKFDLAIEDYTRAINIKHDYVEAYINRGSAYNKKMEFDSAIKDFTKAIYLKPDSAEAYNNRGNAYNGKRNFGRAIEDYGKVLQLAPNHAGAYTNRGLLWLRLQEWEEFKSELMAARNMGVDIAQSFRDTYGSLGSIEQITGVRLPAEIATLLTN